MPTRPKLSNANAASNLPTLATALPDGGVRGLLHTLGAADAFGNPPPPYTGRVVIESNGERRSGYVYFRSGRVYAVELSGFTPTVDLRLLSGGYLTKAMFDELHKLQPAEVGPTAVEKKYVPSDVIEEINRQMLLASLALMGGWRGATWRWEDDQSTTAFTISALDTKLINTAVDERVAQWNALASVYPAVTKGDAIPKPGPDWSAKAGESTTTEIATILRYVDGVNTVGQIAAVCGFSRFEVAARLAKAVADGLLLVPDPDADETGNEDQIFILDPNDADLDPVDAEIAEATRVVEQLAHALEAAHERLLRAQAKKKQ